MSLRTRQCGSTVSAAETMYLPPRRLLHTTPRQSCLVVQRISRRMHMDTDTDTRCSINSRTRPCGQLISLLRSQGLAVPLGKRLIRVCDIKLRTTPWRCRCVPVQPAVWIGGQRKMEVIMDGRNTLRRRARARGWDRRGQSGDQWKGARGRGRGRRGMGSMGRDVGVRSCRRVGHPRRIMLMSFIWWGTDWRTLAPRAALQGTPGHDFLATLEQKRGTL